MQELIWCARKIIGAAREELLHQRSITMKDLLNLDPKEATELRGVDHPLIELRSQRNKLVFEYKEFHATIWHRIGFAFGGYLVGVIIGLPFGLIGGEDAVIVVAPIMWAVLLYSITLLPRTVRKAREREHLVALQSLDASIIDLNSNLEVDRAALRSSFQSQREHLLSNLTALDQSISELSTLE
jgi:hypothetical protein